MKRICAALLCLSFILASPFALAEDLSVSIRMLSLKVVQMGEQHGDEVYIMITEYPTKGKAHTYHIPTHPLYWPAEHLEKINNIKLWEGQLSKGIASTIVFSFLEKDAPPWNTDDLIGEVKVHVKNVDGKLESKWVLPGRTDTPTLVPSKYGEAQKIELLGEHGHYEVYLLLK